MDEFNKQYYMTIGYLKVEGMLDSVNRESYGPEYWETTRNYIPKLNSLLLPIIKDSF